jgi:hypothetical protein
VEDAARQQQLQLAGMDQVGCYCSSCQAEGPHRAHQAVALVQQQHACRVGWGHQDVVEGECARWYGRVRGHQVWLGRQGGGVGAGACGV